MITKHKQIRKILLALIMIVALCALIASMIFRDGFTRFPGPLKAIAEDSSAPRFVFDAAAHPDWWSLGNVQPDPSETEDDAPISAISVNQCVEGSNCNSFVEKCQASISEDNPHCQDIEKRMNDGCMVHAYHFNTRIDPDAVVANELAEWSGFGTNPTEVGVNTLTMATLEGDKTYQFFQYDTNNGNGAYKRGSAFGFIPLDNGYIEVRGICRHASQLDDTLPILSALRFSS